MRRISSLRLGGELLPPIKVGFPFDSVALAAGKMPALRREVALGDIMQVGIVLPGNGEPCTIPAGRTPNGQFCARTEAATVVADGTLITVLPKSPPYSLAAGTGWLVRPP